MSYMSQISAAAEMGEPFIRLHVHTGELKWICTSCIACAVQKQDIEHVGRCRNKPRVVCSHHSHFYDESENVVVSDGGDECVDCQRNAENAAERCRVDLD